VTVGEVESAMVLAEGAPVVSRHWSKHMKLGLLTRRVVDEIARSPYAPFSTSENVQLDDIALAGERLVSVAR
jgi:hypothetical protein